MKKTVVPWLVLGLLAVAVLPALAGQGGSFQPQVLYPTKFDVSPPLRSITAPPVKPGEVLKPREIVNREIPKVKLGGGGKYDHVQKAPGIMSTPDPLLSFQGLDSDDNQAVLGFRVMPPDTEGDVGPNHYFEWINLVYQIYDKNGVPQLANPLPGNAFWSGFGGPCENDNDGDIIVLYDHFADRWFAQQFSTTAPYRLCIALSQTNDPTGSYYRWEYVFNNNKFPDYPKVGVWPNAYYVGFNQFLNLQNWSGAGALGLCKADMLVGNPSVPMVYFDLYGVNEHFGNMFPANADGTVAGTPDGIFLEWDEAAWMGDPTDTVRIWYFHLDCATPANSTFGNAGQPNELVSVPDVDSDMCGYDRDCIPQQGTTQKVDALSDRLMYPIQYREFGTYKVLLTAQTVDATGGDLAGVHWRELRNSGSGWSVFQAGTYAPADGNHRWMPSAAMDASGNICVAYSVSSGSIYPSAAYACRDAGDSLGTLGNEVIYKAGTGYQSGGNRWGDYSATHLDTDDCTFWTVQEYGQASGSFFWSTYVASFKMPSCTSGPSGTVHGTVTNAITTNPIANAQVQAQGTTSGPYTTFTNDSGQYSFSLPPDTYDLTFSAFGYEPLTVNGVVVTDGGDVTQDAALQPTATADLDGYVMGHAHGWPLYAEVVVKYSGSPVAQTFTNPFNGYYSFTGLPATLPYSIEVTSLIAGYNPATHNITTLPPAGWTENFSLTEDGTQDFVSCVLQGGLNENFDEGPFPPQGWKVEVYNSNTSNNWRRNDAWGRANVVPGGSGFAAGADSDKAGYGSGNFDTALVTPWIQMPATPRELAYNHYFRPYYSSDRGYVDICVSPCSSWTNLQTFTSTNSTAQTVDLSAYAGQLVKIRFRYVSGEWAWYWYIDNVRTQEPAVPPIPDNPTFSCNPVPGTLVEGFVTDANTTLPVVGATVLNNNTGRSATTVATSADNNIPDGFYYLFVPLPGSGPSTRTFTASKTGYGNDVKTATLPPNATYQLNFALPAGWLQVSPASLFSRLYTGQDEHQTLVLNNVGGMPVNYQLIVIPQATTWPHFSPVVQGPAPSGPASLGRAPHVQPSTEKPGPKPYLTSVEAYAVDVYPGGNLVHWNDLTVPGTWNVVAADPNTDFGGDFLLGDFSKLYVLDYTNNQLATVDTTNGARTIIGSAVPTGGQVWTGLTASVGGTLYATSTDDCSASTLYTIDPNSGAATVVGPITNAPCAIAVAINPAGDMYVVDIVNDNLVKVDPATGAGTIVGALGINANYAQGMDFDDVSGTLYWAAYSSSGALRVIDTTTGASTLVGAFPGGAEVDALAVKSFAGGVCWLTLNPSSGSVPANSTVNVDAYFQVAADGSCPPIYGAQRGTIQVIHDDAYPVSNPTVCLYRAFNDVPSSNPFDKYIHAIAGAKITQGYLGNFNPATNMLRHLMARWLLLGRYGPTYSPPPCQGNIFADVDCESTPNADWIEDLYNKGITTGCATNPLRYCPNDPVKRQQMAVFLIRAKVPNPATYTPPPCTGIFSDVPCPSFFADWIEELYNSGVTQGCGGTNFCPQQFTLKQQMSAFVQRNWSIPMCP